MLGTRANPVGRRYARSRAATSPVIVTELLHDDSMVHDRPEGGAALKWARQVDGWDPQWPAL